MVVTGTGPVLWCFYEVFGLAGLDVRPRAIASVIVNAIVMRSRICARPRINGWSNP